MITNITKDSMGISFDGQFGTMRKPENFCVYSKSSSSQDKIMIQSEKRFGIITISEKKLVLSTSRNNATSLTLQVDIMQGKAIIVNVASELGELTNAIEMHYKV